MDLFEGLLEFFAQFLFAARAWAWGIATAVLAAMALVIEDPVWRIVCGGLSIFFLIGTVLCLVHSDKE